MAVSLNQRYEIGHSLRPGIYKDGHEGGDVAAHRHEYVAQEAAAYFPAMDAWSDGGGTEMGALVPASSGKATHVAVFHDESIFSTNEGRSSYYAQDGNEDSMFRKTKGKSIMVSGFICACHGAMGVAGGDKEKLEAGRPGGFELSPKMFPGQLSAFTSIEPGSAPGADGWWKGEDVVRQTAEVIDIFESLHPGKVGVFTFDNSTNHGCYPDGALRARTVGVNVNPGGKNAPGTTGNPKMMDGWHMKGGTRVAQSMHFDDGQFKGTKAILVERGRLPGGTRLRGSCTKKNRATVGNMTTQCIDGEECCCQNVCAPARAILNGGPL